MQGSRKARKQRNEAAKHVNIETGQKEDRTAGQQGHRNSATEGSREAGKGKRGSREAAKQRS